MEGLAGVAQSDIVILAVPVARMAHVCRVLAPHLRPGTLVLDVGAGLGYSSAVIARMAEAVIAVEDDEGRASEAQITLSEQGADNAVVHQGDLVNGAAEHGPYDVILLQGGVEALPEGLLAQLKEGGRIAALFVEGALGVVRVGSKLDGDINWTFAFNAMAPVMPGFANNRALQLKGPCPLYPPAHVVDSNTQST